MSPRFDVVVVGAGVIGLSIAFELLRRDRSVLVVERSTPGAGASRVAAGMLAPVSEAEDHPEDLSELCLESVAAYPEFVSGLERVAESSVRYRDEGTLLVALCRDDQVELERFETILQTRQLAFERLCGSQLVELEPHLSPRALSGLRVPGDHQVDPRALLVTLQRAVQRLGGRFLCPAEVCEIVARDGRLDALHTIDAQGGEATIEARQAVLTAGAWSSTGIRCPTPLVPVRPVRGQILRLKGPALLNHVVRHPDVYLIPRADGELLVGATVEEMGFDLTPSAGAVMDLLRHAWDLLPGSYDLEFSAVDVGLRPATEDHRPVLGPTELEGLFVATGHHRNGILLAPATAHALADWVTGKVPVGCAAQFTPSFAPRAPSVP